MINISLATTIRTFEKQIGIKPISVRRTMFRNQSESKPDLPNHPKSVSSSPILSPSNTDTAHPEKRHSKMGHIMTSIRESLAQEQDRLFHHNHHRQSLQEPTAKIAECLRDQHEATKIRAWQETLWQSETEAKESISPAVEARK